MVPGFSDHRSSVGMADEDCRSVLRSKSSLGNRYVVLQRYRRILHNADTVAISPEDLIDTLPARAVHKGTVHENDVIDVIHGSQLPFDLCGSRGVHTDLILVALSRRCRSLPIFA